MEMNQKYWKKYYKEKKEMFAPSNFAIYCRKYIGRHDSVLDFAAGDFRDTGMLAIYCNHKIRTVEPHNNDKSYFNYQNIIDVAQDKHCATVVYARWALHAIDEDEENALIAYTKHCKAKMLLEFRVSESDDKSHDRRVINAGTIVKKLNENGFKIKLCEINYGFSKHGKDDPLLCRIIAEHQDYKKHHKRSWYEDYSRWRIVAWRIQRLWGNKK